MAELGVVQKEYNYLTDNISEGFRLIGQDAKLYLVETDSEDIYLDPTYTYSEYRDIALVFDSNPRPILKKFNWFKEDEELPYVVYLVAKDNSYKGFEVRDGMIIEIASVFGFQDTRKFRVSNVRADSIDPLVWICKIVPLREKIDMNPDTPEHESTVEPKTDTNFAYLRRDKECP